MRISSFTWQHILRLITEIQQQSMHLTIASVSKDGMPNVSPIGTFFLNDQQHGFFFDRYTKQLSENLENNPNVCICAVNSSRFFWLKSLFKGQFLNYPGVRLYARVGEKRAATAAEKQQIQQRIQLLSWTKGAQLIWSEFDEVREVEIVDYRWIEYPHMLEVIKTKVI